MDLIIRLNRFGRDRAGNWVLPEYGMVIPYEKMLMIIKRDGFKYEDINVNEDYLRVILYDNKPAFIHYDKFENLDIIEEGQNDRARIEIQE